MNPEQKNEDEGLRITESITIPLSELKFRFSRSGGPGGQHVNRTETRVEVLLDVAGSSFIPPEAKERILRRLGGYADSDGVLHVVSSTTRSQLENRADAVERLRSLLQAALRPRKHRLPTAPTRASRERRLQGKRQRSGTKQSRRRVDRSEME